MENDALECKTSGSMPGKAYSGYQWTYFSTLPEGPIRSRAESFLALVNWPALLEYASKARKEIHCKLLPDIGLGYNHMVRIVEFTDKARWVARLRLPPLAKCDSKDAMKTTQCEINTISLLQQKTSIPIPKIYAFEAQSNCVVNASFMLMECLEGNVGMDLGMKIPTVYKKAFLGALAKIHVQLSTVQLPKIGTILSKNDDGTYEQGPIPGLGGPFDTATEFFEAWANSVKFGMTDEQLKSASGEHAGEIFRAVSSFGVSIKELAGSLSVCDRGPFPLCHGDFGHNNIIVDDDYNILGVIDWETAFAGPWEVFGDFPLTLATVPPAMDAPWNYDDNGFAKSTDVLQKFTDQKDYVDAVSKEENLCGGNSHCLSTALSDSRRQHLATAMRLYQNGKIGWYSSLIDKFNLIV